MTLEVDVYCRVSGPGQEDNTSLETQEEKSLDYATQRGYRVRKVWREVPTGTELDRSVLNAIRRDIRAARIGGLIIYAYDRLARNQSLQAVVLYEARENDVLVESVTEPVDDSATGQFMRAALAFVAEIEHDKIVERTGRGRKRRAESGKLSPGSVPLYGYRWQRGEDGRADAYVVDNETAWVVKTIFERTARGETGRSIVRWLNEQGISTPSCIQATRGEIGNRPVAPLWRQGSLWRIITNTAYKGAHVQWKRQHIKEKRRNKETGEVRTVLVQRRRTEGTYAVTETVCPPIVDEALWLAANAQAKRNQDEAPRNNHNPEATLLRSGYIYCGHCMRKAAVYFYKPRGRWNYQCRYSRNLAHHAGEVCKENGFTIRAAEIDEQVWAAVSHIITQPDILKAAWEWRRTRSSTEREDVAANIATTQHLLDEALAKRASAERAHSRAIASHEDDYTIDRCNHNISEANREVVQYTKRLAELQATNTEREVSDTQMHYLVAQAEAANWHLPGYSYADKRRWLHMLGVRVYVYREGNPQPPHGARWRLMFEWDGLNQLLPDILAPVANGTTPPRSSSIVTPSFRQ